MARKPPAPQSAPATNWVAIGAIALFGGAFGAGLTYLALRPAKPSPGGVSAAVHPDPAQHLPSPELTAGQSPAQADRTLGNFYYDHRNWPMAMQHYEAAIRQGSDDADIRTDLGNVYRFSGRPDDALIQYQLAQRMNPAHEFSLFNQGGLYLDLQQPGKALEAWQAYLARFPNGRSAAAARQLIAQAGGGASVPAVGTPATPVAPGISGAEGLILRQIEAARSKESRP